MQQAKASHSTPAAKMVGGATGALGALALAAACAVPSLLMWGRGTMGSSDDMEAAGNESLVDRAAGGQGLGSGKMKWVLGAAGESCTRACRRALGAGCDNALLKTTNTAARVKAAAAAVGRTCASPDGETAEWKYKHNPGICIGDSCCDGSCKGICGFGDGGGNCDTEPSHVFSRLCPCAGVAVSAIERITSPFGHWPSGITGMHVSGGSTWYTRAFSLL